MEHNKTNILHFLRLLRFGNIVIIAFTMIVIKFIVFEAWVARETSFQWNKAIDISKADNVSDQYDLNFILLVMCVCIIAAAGNIINDYFDVKADRVNRPDKIIIGKYIKRRWAIVTHWGFNIAGTLIATYLGYYYKSIWIVIIPVLSATLLWLYSVYFKRQVFIGNFVIAFLTGLVILLTMHFMLLELPYVISYQYPSIDLEPAVFLSLLLASFAVITNFTREIVKDMHDMPGDIKIKCRTLPIVYGVKYTKLLIGILLFIQLFFMILLLSSSYKSEIKGSIWFTLGIALALITLYLAAFIINIKAKTPAGHYRISLLLKLIMLMGLLFPLNLLL